MLTEEGPLDFRFVLFLRKGEFWQHCVVYSLNRATLGIDEELVDRRVLENREKIWSSVVWDTQVQILRNRHTIGRPPIDPSLRKLRRLRFGYESQWVLRVQRREILSGNSLATPSASVKNLEVS